MDRDMNSGAEAHFASLNGSIVRVMLKAAALLLIVGCFALSGCSRMAYGPINRKLSSVATQKYLKQFQALGVIDIEAEEPFTHYDHTNGHITKADGTTVDVPIDMNLGGATTFKASLVQTPHGSAIAVRNNDDHDVYTFDEISGQVEIGIDQALSGYQAIQQSNATWSGK